MGIVVELFRPFCRWSFYYSGEGHRSSFGDTMPLDLRWKESTDFGPADGK